MAQEYGLASCCEVFQCACREQTSPIFEPPMSLLTLRFSLGEAMRAREDEPSTAYVGELLIKTCGGECHSFEGRE